jgi:two-component system response regulator HydG
MGIVAPERQSGAHALVVLLVSPEDPEIARLRGHLESEGHEVVWVRDRDAAANLLDSRQVDALVSPLSEPRIHGLALLELARERNPELGAILIIRPDEEERATQAMARGVIDFQRRPINPEKAARMLARLGERHGLLEEVSRLSQRLDHTLGLPNLVGNSGAMSRLRSQLREVAPQEAHVLLVGEEGTGKDLVAEVLHQHSPRRNGPLVRIDCAALPARLLARELFGRPAGADGVRRAGLLEAASAGTLFLDHVTALPAAVQARVAEVLRTGQVRPGIEALPVEIHPRIVAATEGDPAAMVESGLLHEGFLDLISAARIDLAPLRYRRRDISTLARHFLAERAEETGRASTLTRAALDQLGAYDWPGNVRELKDAMRELADSVVGDRPIDVDDLPAAVREPHARDEVLAFPLGTSLAAAERQLILQTLRLCHGNREKAAGVLGIGVRTLYRKLQSYRGESER